MSYINDNWELLQLGEVKTHSTAHYRDGGGSWGVAIIKLLKSSLCDIVWSCLQLANTPRTLRYQNVLEALNNNSDM